MTKKILYFFCFIALWSVLHKKLNIASYVFPPPCSVINVFYHQYSTLLENTFYTLQVIISGFVSSIILAFITAIILDCFPNYFSWLKSVILSIQSLPSIILLPFLILWLGYGFLPKFVIITLSCYFPVAICCINGLSITPQIYNEVIYILKGQYWRSLYHVRIPSSLPHIFSGLQIAAISAPLNSIAIDWMGASHGLGYLITRAHGNLQTDIMVAASFIVIAIAWLLNILIIKIRKKIIFWKI